MSNNEDRDSKLEPFNVIFSPRLYQTIKHNSFLSQIYEKEGMTDEELNEYENFKTLFRDFLKKLNQNDPSAFSILSNIMNMWGYSRKYCGMCGKPIIGPSGHIQNRLTCSTCFHSFKITEKLFKMEERQTKPTNQENATKVEKPTQLSEDHTNNSKS